MKKINIIIKLTILLLIYTTTMNSMSINTEIKNQNSLAEQIYTRLVISSRIIEYTDKYIDSKKAQRSNIPDSIWQEVKNSIDYNVFKSKAIQILNNNLTSSQMQRIINESSNRPSIPIPTLKIKKEMYDLMPNFQKNIDSTINQVLKNKGY